MAYVVITPKDELYHYGVKGMKWGVRRRIDAHKAYSNSRRDSNNRNKEIIKNRLSGTPDNRKIQNGISRRIEANKAYSKSMKDSSDANKQIIKDKMAARRERKASIKSNYEKINQNLNLKDKLIYNDATRKKAAKYMTDNNMSMSDARKKANNVAKRNTAVFLGAYGAIAVGSLYMSKR